MNFRPKTEKEIAESNLAPAGVYPFEVLKAESKRSKAGNEMIEIQLRLFMADGGMRQVFDWLLEKNAYKLFHFCAYTGLATNYQEGTLVADDCVGKTGYAKIAIKPDAAGEPRNNVADYVRAPGATTGLKVDGVLAEGKPQLTDAQLANQTNVTQDDSDVPF